MGVSVFHVERDAVRSSRMNDFQTCEAGVQYRNTYQLEEMGADPGSGCEGCQPKIWWIFSKR